MPVFITLVILKQNSQIPESERCMWRPCIACRLSIVNFLPAYITPLDLTYGGAIGTSHCMSVTSAKEPLIQSPPAHGDSTSKVYAGGIRAVPAHDQHSLPDVQHHCSPGGLWPVQRVCSRGPHNPREIHAHGSAPDAAHRRPGSGHNR